jgi:crotonobetainyl-CoA:carnitine CoA-transferase CaiB-like acyl-CoA transferase
VNNNRNKRMIAIDLKRSEGRGVLARLVERSDVLFHNMRAGAAERLGLGFSEVSRLNPRIIHCSAIGFGRGGEYRDRPAFDDIIQAASGIAGLSVQQGGEPRFVPTILADKVAALHVVYGILAALVARSRGLDGPIEIEAPMFESIVAFMLNEHLADATFHPDGVTGYPRVLSPDRRPFRTADGWIAVLPYTKEQWRRFLNEAGRGEVTEQPWFFDGRERQRRVHELYAIVAECLPSRTTREWLSQLERCDVPCSAVTMPDDLLDDPHLSAIGFFNVPESYPPGIVRALPQPVRFDGIASEDDTPPRPLGADTQGILRDFGIEQSEIESLVAAQVVHCGAQQAHSQTNELGSPQLTGR